jgi:thiol-disulfide isomerase/thioredoxin
MLRFVSQRLHTHTSRLADSRRYVLLEEHMRSTAPIRTQVAASCVLVGLVLLSAPGCSTSAKPAQTGNVIRFVRNPDAAPDFKLESIDGKPLTLAAARGKVVLLNFWATWCGPCRAEIPDLIELQRRYNDKLQIIGLTVDEDDPDVVKQAVAETGINYVVGMSSPEVRKSYGGIAALPTSFVLDTEGRAVQKHEGLRNPALYEMEIRALLGMPINARVETFEDTGQVFIAHADRASELPGVDLSKLTPEQKEAALHRFNAEGCTCGCGYTLAQCRIYDHNCPVSKARTDQIIAEVSGKAQKTASSPSHTPKPEAAKPDAPRH